MRDHGDLHAEYLWVTAPSDTELEARLRKRGSETEESIQLRLKNSREETAMAATLPFDFSMVNADQTVAYDTLKKIVEARRRQCGLFRARRGAAEKVDPATATATASGVQQS